MRNRIWVLPLLTAIAATASCDLPGAPPPTAFVLPTPNQTLTAVFAPTPTPVVAPTSTSTPPPSPIPTIVTPGLQPATATAASLTTRPNGVAVEAAFVSAAPVIDGDLSDWSSLPYRADQIVFGAGSWSGANDASGTFAIAWDATNLYVAARVVDDAHVQISTGDNLWKGDEVEIQLDTNLSADFYAASLSSDDYQFGISPGDFGSNPATDRVWYPTSKAGRITPATTIGRKKTAQGYDLEVRIPWSALGVTATEGTRFGFTLSISDNDLSGKAAQQSMVSSVGTRKLLNPTTWGTLVLVGATPK